MKIKSVFKILIAFICSSIFMGSMSVLASSTNQVSGNLAEQSIRNLYDAGYLSSLEKFRPDDYITRAEYMTLINNVMGFERESDDVNRFVDVQKSDWFYKEVSKALAAGYTKGIGDNFMAPNKNLNREQALVIMARVLSVAPQNFRLNNIADLDKVSKWAYSDISGAIDYGLFINVGNSKVAPKEILTRAEAALILDKFYQDIRRYGYTGTYGAPDDMTLFVGGISVGASGVHVKNMNVENEVTIEEVVGEGQVYMTNVDVNGEIHVKGGGSNSIYLNKVDASKIFVEKKGVRVVLSNGKVDYIKNEDGIVVVKAGMTVKELIAEADSTIIVEQGGQVEKLDADFAFIEVNNGGHIKEIVSEGSEINLNNGSLVDILNSHHDEITIQQETKVATATINASDVKIEKNAVVGTLTVVGTEKSTINNDGKITKLVSDKNRVTVTGYGAVAGIITNKPAGGNSNSGGNVATPTPKPTPIPIITVATVGVDTNTPYVGFPLHALAKGANNAVPTGTVTYQWYYSDVKDQVAIVTDSSLGWVKIENANKPDYIPTTVGKYLMVEAVGQNNSTARFVIEEAVVQTYTINSPVVVEKNGIKATLQVNGTNFKNNDLVKASISISGNPAVPANHTVGISSATYPSLNSLETFLIKENYSKTKTIEFNMPSFNIEDLVLTHTFVQAVPQSITPATYVSSSALADSPIAITDGAYTENDGGAAREHIYTWKLSNNEAGENFEVVSNKRNYITSWRDFGKYVWVETTPVGVNGLKGVSVASSKLRIGTVLEVKASKGSANGNVKIVSVNGNAYVNPVEIFESATLVADSDNTSDIVTWVDESGGNFVSRNSRTTVFTPFNAGATTTVYANFSRAGEPSITAKVIDDKVLASGSDTVIVSFSGLYLAKKDNEVVTIQNGNFVILGSADNVISSNANGNISSANSTITLQVARNDGPERWQTIYLSAFGTSSSAIIHQNAAIAPKLSGVTVSDDDDSNENTNIKITEQPNVYKYIYKLSDTLVQTPLVGDSWVGSELNVGENKKSIPNGKYIAIAACDNDGKVISFVCVQAITEVETPVLTVGNLTNLPAIGSDIELTLTGKFLTPSALNAVSMTGNTFISIVNDDKINVANGVVDPSNDKITLRIDTNTSLAPRTDKITISVAGGTTSFSALQLGATEVPLLMSVVNVEDDDESDDKTKITMSSLPSGAAKFLYLISSNSSVVPTPIVGADWTFVSSNSLAVSDSSSIMVPNGKNIGIAACDLNNKVISFKNVVAITELEKPILEVHDVSISTFKQVVPLILSGSSLPINGERTVLVSGNSFVKLGSDNKVLISSHVIQASNNSITLEVDRNNSNLRTERLEIIIDGVTSNAFTFTQEGVSFAPELEGVVVSDDELSSHKTKINMPDLNTVTSADKFVYRIDNAEIERPFVGTSWAGVSLHPLTQSVANLVEVKNGQFIGIAALDSNEEIVAYTSRSAIVLSNAAIQVDIQGKGTLGNKALANNGVVIVNLSGTALTPNQPIIVESSETFITASGLSLKADADGKFASTQLTFNLDENAESARNADIKFTVGEIDKTVTVYQAGAYDPSIDAYVSGSGVSMENPAASKGELLGNAVAVTIALDGVKFTSNTRLPVTISGTTLVTLSSLDVTVISDGLGELVSSSSMIEVQIAQNKGASRDEKFVISVGDATTEAVIYQKAVSPQAIEPATLDKDDVIIGEEVTATLGTFHLNDADAVGAHSFAWKRSDKDDKSNPIVLNDTDIFYQPVSADFGKYLWLVTTPNAVDAEFKGVAVDSKVIRVGSKLEVTANDIDARGEVSVKSVNGQTEDIEQVTIYGPVQIAVDSDNRTDIISQWLGDGTFGPQAPSKEVIFIPSENLGGLVTAQAFFVSGGSAGIWALELTTGSSAETSIARMGDTITVTLSGKYLTPSGTGLEVVLTSEGVVKLGTDNKIDTDDIGSISSTDNTIELVVSENTSADNVHEIGLTIDGVSCIVEIYQDALSIDEVEGVIVKDDPKSELNTLVTVNYDPADGLKYYYRVSGSPIGIPLAGTLISAYVGAYELAPGVNSIEAVNDSYIGIFACDAADLIRKFVEVRALTLETKLFVTIEGAGSTELNSAAARGETGEFIKAKLVVSGSGLSPSEDEVLSFGYNGGDNFVSGAGLELDLLDIDENGDLAEQELWLELKQNFLGARFEEMMFNLQGNQRAVSVYQADGTPELTASVSTPIIGANGNGDSDLTFEVKFEGENLLVGENLVSTYLDSGYGAIVEGDSTITADSTGKVSNALDNKITFKLKPNTETTDKTIEIQFKIASGSFLVVAQTLVVTQSAFIPQECTVNDFEFENETWGAAVGYLVSAQGVYFANDGGVEDENSLTYQWYRDDPANPIINGATSSEYKPTSEDFGKYIWLTVTANNSLGNNITTDIDTDKLLVGAVLSIDIVKGGYGNNVKVSVDGVEYKDPFLITTTSAINLIATSEYLTDKVKWTDNMGVYFDPDSNSLETRYDPAFFAGPITGDIIITATFSNKDERVLSTEYPLYAVSSSGGVVTVKLAGANLPQGIDQEVSLTTDEESSSFFTFGADSKISVKADGTVDSSNNTIIFTVNPDTEATSNVSKYVNISLAGLNAAISLEVVRFYEEGQMQVDSVMDIPSQYAEYVEIPAEGRDIYINIKGKYIADAYGTYPVSVEGDDSILVSEGSVVVLKSGVSDVVFNELIFLSIAPNETTSIRTLKFKISALGLQSQEVVLKQLAGNVDPFDAKNIVYEGATVEIELEKSLLDLDAGQKYVYAEGEGDAPATGAIWKKVPVSNYKITADSSKKVVNIAICDSNDKVVRFTRISLANFTVSGLENVQENNEEGSALTLKLFGTKFSHAIVDKPSDLSSFLSVVTTPSTLAFGSGFGIEYDDETTATVKFLGNSSEDYDSKVELAFNLGWYATELGMDLQTIGFLNPGDDKMLPPTDLSIIYDNGTKSFTFTPNGKQLYESDYEYTTNGGLNWVDCAGFGNFVIPFKSEDLSFVGILKVRTKAVYAEVNEVMVEWMAASEAIEVYTYSQPRAADATLKYNVTTGVLEIDGLDFGGDENFVLDLSKISISQMSVFKTSSTYTSETALFYDYGNGKFEVDLTPTEKFNINLIVMNAYDSIDNPLPMAVIAGEGTLSSDISGKSATEYLPNLILEGFADEPVVTLNSVSNLEYDAPGGTEYSDDYGISWKTVEGPIKILGDANYWFRVSARNDTPAGRVFKAEVWKFSDLTEILPDLGLKASSEAGKTELVIGGCSVEVKNAIQYSYDGVTWIYLPSESLVFEAVADVTKIFIRYIVLGETPILYSSELSVYDFQIGKEEVIVPEV